LIYFFIYFCLFINYLTYLLIYYSLVATLIASFMTYVYGKVNYHKAKDDASLIRAQS
jgi:hypothetical protein